jgi:glycopeptide antibiotics resistance protein
MLRKLIIAAAWAMFAFIVFVSLANSGLRPRLVNPDVERFCAFAVLGLLLGMAYPNRQTLFAIIIVAAAVLLEVLQLFIPTRDGEILELIVKVAGGLVGIICAGFLTRRLRKKD